MLIVVVNESRLFYGTVIESNKIETSDIQEVVK